MKPDDLSSLIDLIYQAGLQTELWPEVLTRLVARFGGTATLFIQDRDRSSAGFLGFVNMDPKFMRDYAEYFAALNPARHEVLTAPEGTIIDIAALMDEPTYLRSEFYNDFFRPMGVHHALGTVVQRSELFGTHLGLQRAKQAGDYADPEREEILMLARHIRRSTDISRRITAARWEQEVSSSLLVRRAASGFVFVDAESRVLLADKVAEQIFRADNGVNASGGRLSAIGGDNTERLHAMIRSAALTASGKGTYAGGILGLPRRRMIGPPLALLVCPWHGNPLAFGVSGPAVLVFVEDPTLSPKPAAAGAATLYGLTAAEARLLDALLAGDRLADYAESASVSLATVKTHLRAIFLKTGQRRQADLLRLILSSGIAQHSGG